MGTKNTTKCTMSIGKLYEWIYEEIRDNNLLGKSIFSNKSKIFSQIFYFLFKRLDFLIKFSNLQKSKISLMNSWILSEVSKHPQIWKHSNIFLAKLLKFWTFSFKILKLFKNFLLNNFSNKNWYFSKNIVIIFLRNTIFLKKYSNFFPNAFKISQLFLKHFLNTRYKEF